MKFIVSIFLTALLAYTFFLFDSLLPWWTFAIGALVAGWVVPQKAWLSWIAGFVGVYLCWTLLIWFFNNDNHNILSTKMAAVIGINASPVMLVLLSALPGAVVGAFAAFTGAFMRKKPMPVKE